jgi:hypothetical protein
MPNTMSPESVQHYLDHTHDYSRPLTVIFIKKDGTQRKITGVLRKSHTRVENVAIFDPLKPRGYSSFNINRVLYIATAKKGERQ